MSRIAAVRAFTVLLPGLALSPGALGQVKLSVIADGRRAGEASYSHKLMPDGGKLVQLTVTLQSPDGKAVNLRSETKYDAKGIAERMFHESLADKGRTRRQVTVTFDADGAVAVEEVGGKRQTKRVPLVKTAPLENPSQFWFLRGAPKLGDRVRYYHFDVGSLSWELNMSAYLGPKEVTIAGKKLKGHQIQENRSVAVVDDKGMLISIDLGGVRMERVPAP